jgi:hypothetical protein
VVAPGGDGTTTLAFGAPGLFGGRGDGIYKVDVTKGTATQVIPLPGRPVALVVTDKILWALSGPSGGVFASDPAGAGPVDNIVTGVNVKAMVVLDTTAYYVADGDVVVNAVTLADHTVSTATTADGPVTSLAIFALDNVVWGSVSGSIGEKDFGPGPLAMVGQPVRALAFGNGDLFFLADAVGGGNALSTTDAPMTPIQSYPKNAIALTRLFSSSVSTGGVLLFDGAHSIVRADKSGAHAVATENAGVAAIAPGTTDIYWAAGDGAIRRISVYVVK